MGEAIKYFILGVVQGISEILPISSSGHLQLAKYLLGVNTSENLMLEIMLHFASLIALIIFFWKLIVDIIRDFFIYIFKRKAQAKHNFMLGVYVIVASIPVAIVGFLFEDQVNRIFANLIFTAIGFLITSIMLYMVYNRKTHNVYDVDMKKALFIGSAQMIGVLPGVSRSGTTLAAAKLANVEITKAKEFVFLLFLPVAFGSFVFSLGDINEIQNAGSGLSLNLIGMISSFFFTFLSLNFIFKKLKFEHYKYFSMYCLFISIVTFICYFTMK